MSDDGECSRPVPVVVRCNPAFFVCCDPFDQIGVRDATSRGKQGTAHNRTQLVDNHDMARITEPNGIDDRIEKILHIVVPMQPTYDRLTFSILYGSRDPEKIARFVPVKTKAGNPYRRALTRRSGRMNTGFRKTASRTRHPRGT